MSRIHIPLVTVVLAFVLALSATVLSTPASASERVIPYYNVNGYSTVAVIINPSSLDITLPSQLICNLCDGPVIKAHSITRETVTLIGAGIIKRELPNALVIKSEIKTSYGAVVQCEELFADSESYIYEIGDRAYPYNGGIFLAADTDAIVTVFDEFNVGKSVDLRAGKGVVIPPARGVNHFVGQLGGGTFYSFGFINDAVTGSVQIVPSWPAMP